MCDHPTRAGRVLSAELVSRRRSFSAVWFDPEQDGEGSYFDLEGNSVRRAFLKSPVELRFRVSSRFSRSRFNPVLKLWRAHRGVDFAATRGSPARSTGDGTITRREWSDTYGNWVEVRHANGWTTRYAHLESFASGQRVGTRVSQSDVIGYTGATGLVTGPNLHYEMLQYGTARNPAGVDLGSGDPVPASQWDQWVAQRIDRFALLEARVPRPWEVELTLKVRADKEDSQSEGSD